MSKGDQRKHIIFEEEEETDEKQDENQKKFTAAEISAYCPSKTRLVAKYLQLSQLESLKPFKELRGVDLSHNNLKDLQFLGDSTDLVWLNLSYNCIEQLDSLSRLRNLEVLNVSHNRLKSLSGIANCKPLQALVANDNRLTSLDSLILLENLNSLVLSRNYLQDLSPIRSVISLKKISCSCNQLRQIPDLSRLVHLKELRFNNNLIECLPQNLASNRNLQILDLGHNRIRDMNTLSILSSLPYLKVVNLVGNPVCMEKTFQETFLKICPHLEQFNGKTLRVGGKLYKQRKTSKKEQSGADATNESLSSLPVQENDKKRSKSSEMNRQSSLLQSHMTEDSGCIAIQQKKRKNVSLSETLQQTNNTRPNISQFLNFGADNHQNAWGSE
eukprot:jgi/Galph1/5681/GphlegSOOS_G4372.1